MNISEIQQINWRRAQAWHKGQPWNALEWAGAMCGEAGEAANVAKKIRRIEQDLVGNEASDHKITDADELRNKLGSEIAGTILYAMLLATSQGLDISTELRLEFNRKSRELGFPQTI